MVIYIVDVIDNAVAIVYIPDNKHRFLVHVPKENCLAKKQSKTEVDYFQMQFNHQQTC